MVLLMWEYFVNEYIRSSKVRDRSDYTPLEEPNFDHKDLKLMVIVQVVCVAQGSVGIKERCCKISQSLMVM